MPETTPQEMNKFVQTVDEFMANYAKLISPETKAGVYATKNPALINDYENAVSQSRILKRTIEATVGAWNAAKKGWASVTSTTSIAIGDAIDTIRGWFGYEPAGGEPATEMGVYDISSITGGTLGALGVIQLPAAAWIAGIIASALLLNGTMNKIFISIEASRIQRADPTISRERALSAASKIVSTDFFGKATLPLIVAGLLAAYLLLGNKSK